VESNRPDHEPVLYDRKVLSANISPGRMIPLRRRQRQRGCAGGLPCAPNDDPSGEALHVESRPDGCTALDSDRSAGRGYRVARHAPLATKTALTRSICQIAAVSSFNSYVGLSCRPTNTHSLDFMGPWLRFGIHFSQYLNVVLRFTVPPIAILDYLAKRKSRNISPQGHDVLADGLPLGFCSRLVNASKTIGRLISVRSL